MEENDENGILVSLWKNVRSERREEEMNEGKNKRVNERKGKWEKRREREVATNFRLCRRQT